MALCQFKVNKTFIVYAEELPGQCGAHAHRVISMHFQKCGNQIGIYGCALFNLLAAEASAAYFWVSKILNFSST